VEIIVESSALYSISAIIMITMLALPHDTFTFSVYGDVFFSFMGVSGPSIVMFRQGSSLTLNASQNLAPALIMLRIALGRARPDAEWSGNHISGLQFSSTLGASVASTHQRSQGVTSTIITVSRSQTQAEQLDTDIEKIGEAPAAALDSREK
jgi:hypothetical protein